MMILTGREFYAIVTAMVPLYIALFLAYGSVKWWKIFTPVQCSGINRFVAFFAVPFLSFHIISINDPYTMDFRFIAADTLQKVIMLVVLSLWAKFTKTSGSFDWLITLFSLSTLPNTLIMGIPLMGALYGHFTAPLLVQVLVMQCIIWYTLLLVFFEYRNAKILILEQFPESGGDVVSIKVDADVVSLDRQDFLETTTEVGGDGKLHVTVSKSNASRRSMEIYSVSSSVIQTPRCSDLNQSDIFSVRGFPGGRLSSFGRAARRSSYEIDSAPVSSHLDHAAGSRLFAEGEKKETCVSITKGQQPLYSKPPLQESRRQSISSHGVHMFHRSSSAPAIDYKGGRRYLWESTEQSSRLNQHGAKEIKELVSDQTPIDDISLGGDKERINVELDSTAEQPPTTGDEGSGKRMPSASVMIRLIVMMVWRKLSRNPNLYASILGLIWSLVSFRWHVEMPKIIANSISLISNAGLGMAMFSLGLFMALQPKIIACGRSNTALAMAVKFLIGPGVMAVATVIVGIRGNLLRIAVVQATICEGIVPFVFATEYNVHTTILSTAVIFGMLITVPVTLVYYIILKL